MPKALLYQLQTVFEWYWYIKTFVSELKVFASLNHLTKKYGSKSNHLYPCRAIWKCLTCWYKKVKSVYEGYVKAGRGQVIEFSVP
jgi:hypothetical protein